MLSFIIPCEDSRKDYLLSALIKYQGMKYAADCEFLIVTHSLQPIKDFSNVTTIMIPKINLPWINPCQSFNEGVKLAKNKYIVITGPEMLPVTDVIPQLMSEIDNDSVVCRVYEDKGDISNSNLRCEHPGFYFLAMYKAEHIWDINGWDEDFLYGIGYDDNDFGERWIRAGHKHKMVDYIIAYHRSHTRADSFGLPTNAHLLNRNRTRGPKCLNGLVKLEK